MKTAKKKAKEILFDGLADAWRKCTNGDAIKFGYGYVSRFVVDLGVGTNSVDMDYADLKELGAYTVEGLKLELIKLAELNDLNTFKIHNNKEPRIYLSEKEFTEKLAPMLEGKKKNIAKPGKKVERKSLLKQKINVSERLKKIDKEYGSDDLKDTTSTPSSGMK